jgi:hypothetical protein
LFKPNNDINYHVKCEIEKMSFEITNKMHSSSYTKKETSTVVLFTVHRPPNCENRVCTRICISICNFILAHEILMLYMRRHTLQPAIPRRNPNQYGSTNSLIYRGCLINQVRWQASRTKRIPTSQASGGHDQ